MPHKIAGYGWIADLPDGRDRVYSVPSSVNAAGLPAKADLRPQCPPVYDQGQIGSCTGNAIAAAVEFDRMKQGLQAFEPSRLFIYYNERALEGTVNSDAGAQIRDGIKVVASQGTCGEGTKPGEWPYDPNVLTERPNPQCYSSAIKHKTVSYERIVRNLNQMKGCLASGYPFVFGFTVYQAFEDAQVAQTGHACLPDHHDVVIGGHAVMAVGYDDANHWFIVRNSWGTNWGISGYFTMPYEYLMRPNLSDDMWTIRIVQ